MYVCEEKEATQTRNASQSNVLYRQLYRHTRSERKGSKEGRDGDGMTSANQRDAALRETDVRDGEVEKSPTFSGEERSAGMCEQSFIDIRVTLDHTGVEIERRSASSRLP